MCIRDSARGLDAWKGTQELVILRLKEKDKSPGVYRDIKEFGIQNRALQYLVLPLLKVQANLHPNQYGMIGTHAAVKRVAELMTQGYVWAMETDLKDCYPSFDGEKIQGILPLPKKVTQHIMCCAPLNLSLGNDGISVSYTHLRAHETVLDLVCRLLLEKKKK